jgi:uncharacterized protein YbjT (DUF2867 family)
MIITVMGATGRTGRRIAEQLLKGGNTVRALGRSAGRLAELKDIGAQVLVGEPTDAGYLTHAFEGADAVYTLLPYDVQLPDYYARQDRQGEAIATAVRHSGVGHVVFLSSVGADQTSGTGMIMSLHAQEQRLRKIEGIDTLFLRAGSYFENFHGTLGLIKHEGFNCDAVEPDLAIPMVATRDIADAAAQALKACGWSGCVVRELLGPRDLSYAEATRLLGQRIGRPDLAYVQVPYDDMTLALVQLGSSDDVARLYVDIARAINEGRIRSVQGRNPSNTTATLFEDFAGELAQAYAAL